MLPELLPPLLAVFTAFGLGAMGLFGLRMWVHRTMQQDPTEIADSIREQLLEDIRHEVARALEAHETALEELHERLDFAERLLAQAQLPRGEDDREAAIE